MIGFGFGGDSRTRHNSQKMQRNATQRSATADLQCRSAVLAVTWTTPLKCTFLLSFGWRGEKEKKREKEKEKVLDARVDNLGTKRNKIKREVLL